MRFRPFCVLAWRVLLGVMNPKHQPKGIHANTNRTNSITESRSTDGEAAAAGTDRYRRRTALLRGARARRSLPSARSGRTVRSGGLPRADERRAVLGPRRPARRSAARPCRRARPARTRRRRPACADRPRPARDATAVRVCALCRADRVRGVGRDRPVGRPDRVPVISWLDIGRLSGGFGPANRTFHSRLPNALYLIRWSIIDITTGRKRCVSGPFPCWHGDCKR